MAPNDAPDCLAMELAEALARLGAAGWEAVVVQTGIPPKTGPLPGPPRVLRQRLLPSGQVELVVAHAY